MTSLLIAASLLLGYGSPGESTVDRAIVVAEGGKLQIDRTVVKTVCYNESRIREEKDKDGSLVKREYTVVLCKPIAEKQSFSVLIETTRGFDGAGARLTSDDLKKRLAKPTAVLVSFDAQDVDANWFTVLKPEATVLILPQASPIGEPVLPMPIPRPAVTPPPAPSGADAELGFVFQLDDSQNPGPFPTLAGASMDDKGVVHLQTARQHWSTNTVAVKVFQDGKEQEMTKQLRTTTMTVQRREIPKEMVSAMTADGKKVNPEAMALALAKPRVVLATTDGKAADASLSDLVKDDVLVLIPPPPAPPTVYYGGGPYAPPSAPPIGIGIPAAPPSLPPPPVPSPAKKPGI